MNRIKVQRTDVVRLLAIGIVYYVAARLSLRLALVEENVTPFWPPTGIAVVAFLFFRGRVWPGIALGAFFVNLTISPSALPAATIAAGNTLAPYVAARLLDWIGFERDLSRLRDAAMLVFGAALPATLISASIGSASLLFSHAIARSDFLASWSVWWTGDAMGILVVAPFLLAATTRPTGPISLRRSVEAAVVALATIGSSFLIFRTSSPLFVVVFPPLSWAAWRFQQRGASPAVLWLSTVATWAAVHDQGLFDGLELLDKMLALQAFNAAISFTALFLATAVTQRLRADAERREVIEREREHERERYQREHRISETLQRSLLPDTLPDIPDVAVVARYVPATGDVEVGGDWYDVAPLADGRIAVAIGDVAGHGVRAAAAMGQLRTALRTYAFDGIEPAQAIERLNAVLRELQRDAMATVLYAHLDPESGAIGFANAGHPPPLVVEQNGDARFLDGAKAPPVGVLPDVTYPSLADRLAVDATLILYTDGLIEQRGRAISDRLEILRTVSTGPSDNLDELCDRIVASLVPDEIPDDIAIIALRRVSLAGRTLDISRPADPEAAAEVRQVLRRWLAQNGVTEEAMFDFVLATSEACTNVIQHAYGPMGGPLRVTAQRTGDEITVNVSDSGTWRAPELSEGLGGGRGLHLMRGTMDSVDVESGAHGTEVTMRRQVGIGAHHA